MHLRSSAVIQPPHMTTANVNHDAVAFQDQLDIINQSIATLSNNMNAALDKLSESMNEKFQELQRDLENERWARQNSRTFFAKSGTVHLLHSKEGTEWTRALQRAFPLGQCTLTQWRHKSDAVTQALLVYYNVEDSYALNDLLTD